MKIDDLLNKPLDGWILEKKVEVYKTDDDGKFSSSIIFLGDKTIAEAYFSVRPDKHHYKTRDAIVLTDPLTPTDGYEVSINPITVGDDEQIKRELREQILAKLTSSERAVLGLK